MSLLGQWITWTPVHSVALIAVTTVVAVVEAGVLVRWARARGEGLPTDERSSAPRTKRRKFSAGTLSAAAAFVVCTSVSLNTSYRFTEDGLGMHGTQERILSCAAFECLIAMCVLGARERMADPESPSPGWYGGAVWVFAGLSSIPAWHEGGGLSTGTAVRVIVGSFGSALAAHSALGLELKHRSGKESEAPLAQIARDVRERVMARLGLSVRNRTAQEIAQDRAMAKAVDLADHYQRMTDKSREKWRGKWCARRLAKWQDRAGLAGDEQRKALYRERVAQRLYSTKLEITESESPWHNGGTPEAVAEAQHEAERLREQLATAQAEVRKAREEHTRHIEELAARVEAHLLAQAGTPFPGPRAEAHLDDAEDADCIDSDEHDTEESEATEAARRAAAAQGARTLRAEARVPRQQQGNGDDHQEHGDDESAEHTEAPIDLHRIATKKAKIQALYRLRVRPGDPRNVNQITDALLSELAQHGIRFDRGAAHRAVSELHEPAERGRAVGDRELQATA